MLYQIEFHATIAEQAGRFSIADVTAGIHDKLVRRHPHVFGDVAADDAGTVLANWEQIKRDEKGRTSVFDGVARSLPALAYTQHLARKAAKVGFDWPDVDGPLAKVDEELAELREAIASGDADRDRRRARRPRRRRRQRRPPRPRRRRAGGACRGGQVPPPLRGRRGAGRRAWRSTSRGADLAALDALWDEVKAAERGPVRLAPHAAAVRRSGGPPAPRHACRSRPTSRTGTCRTCTACSACTATSCASSSSAPTATARRTSSRSCPTTSPSASTGCCASSSRTACRRCSCAPSSPSAPASATGC